MPNRISHPWDNINRHLGDVVIVHTSHAIVNIRQRFEHIISKLIATANLLSNTGLTQSTTPTN
jgi:hypothetical protein